jgi:hypothetical protein
VDPYNYNSKHNLNLLKHLIKQVKSTETTKQCNGKWLTQTLPHAGGHAYNKKIAY